MAKKRILTGDTPTGKLHVGHYVGSLENRRALQDEYDTFVMFADVHALTTLSSKPEIVHEHLREVVLDNLAVGIDPEKVTFYIESDIPEIFELAAFYSMFITHNTALRNPTIKDEIKMKGLGDTFSLGFINYPIFQAADITCVGGELVPVGVDQVPVVEQTREIVRAVNAAAGEEVLVEPEAKVGRVAKLMGTDGNPKMGKSLGNTIFLSATDDELESQIKGMYTDPNRVHATDPGKVDGNPLFVYLDVFGREEDRVQIEEYKTRYAEGTVGDVEVKGFLLEVLRAFITPIREKRKHYEDNPAEVAKILQEGNKRSRHEANETLQRLKKAFKFTYGTNIT